MSNFAAFGTKKQQFCNKIDTIFLASMGPQNDNLTQFYVIF
jgi:hypothetical protein